MTDVDTTHSTGTPTHTSTALALAAGLAVLGLFVWQVDGVTGPILAGSGAAASLAVSLWLVGQDRIEPVARLVAGLLTLPVAAGGVGATLGAALLLASAYLPLPQSASLSLLILTAVGHVGLVAGSLVAVLGLLLGVRNVVDGETLRTHFWLTVQTALVPGLVGSLFVVGALVAQTGTGGIGASLLAGLLDWLLAPQPFVTHLATVLLLVAVAALSLRAAVGALPVAELLADSGAGETEQRRVRQVRSLLGWLAAVAGLAVLPAAAVEVVLGPSGLRRAVGFGTYRLLVAVTTAPALRLLLCLTTVVAVTITLAVVAVRRLATSSGRTVARQVSPFAAGAIITGGAVVVGQPVVQTVVSTVGSTLPNPADDIFLNVARSLVDFFGAPTLVVVAGALFVTGTAALVGLLRMAVFAGYLSDESAGYSLAAGGLLVATAFVGTLVSQAWVVFAALVGSLFVWDTGRYGTTLGDEMGHHAPTRDAELVHAGGTLGVGLVGVALAYALQRVLAAGQVTPSPAAVVALVGVLAGIVLLVVALR